MRSRSNSTKEISSFLQACGGFGPDIFRFHQRRQGRKHRIVPNLVDLGMDRTDSLPSQHQPYFHRAGGKLGESCRVHVAGVGNQYDFGSIQHQNAGTFRKFPVKADHQPDFYPVKLADRKCSPFPAKLPWKSHRCVPCHIEAGCFRFDQ